MTSAQALLEEVKEKKEKYTQYYQFDINENLYTGGGELRYVKNKIIILLQPKIQMFLVFF